MAVYRVKQLLLLIVVTVIAALGIGMVYAQAGGTALFSVQSGSMEPAVKKGDLVAVNSVPAEALSVGDVITFIKPGDEQATVTHRIVALPESGAIITQGDANPEPDVPLRPAQIIGQVSFHVPYAGHAMDFVRKPLGLLILIYVPALTVIIAELKRLAAYYRSQIYVVPEFLVRR